MKVLIAGEQSQVITKAFTDRGHSAMSCDIEHPGALGLPHYKGDWMDLVAEYFDLVIFHPVCTYLCNSGVWNLTRDPNRYGLMLEACNSFNTRHLFNSPRVATENPIPHYYAAQYIGRADQYIQPWQFGHQQMKATGLWLKNLPKLVPTKVAPPPKDKRERYKWQNVFTCSPGKDRSKKRSVTFQGIADAMADQWGIL